MEGNQMIAEKSIPRHCMITINGQPIPMKFDGILETGQMAFSCEQGSVIIGSNGVAMDMIIELSTKDTYVSAQEVKQ